MAQQDPPDPIASGIERLVAIQQQALEGYREVLERMGESFQMGTYTPSSWLADVFELLQLPLRTAAAVADAATGAEPDAVAAPDLVTVVRVPQGAEAWQFSVFLDTKPLAGLGTVELTTRGFDPASGGFSIDHPRNVAFDPPLLEPRDAMPAKVDVALFSLPQHLEPGCYAGPIQARAIADGETLTLAEVHVRIVPRGGPPARNPATSAEGAGGDRR